MIEYRAKITDNGRILIPGNYRKLLGLKSGDELLLILEEGEIRLLTPDRAIRRAQKLVQEHLSKGGNLRLLQDRGDEADSA